MSYASDQLYKGYLRKNMATIVSKVKPCEIVDHLPCLTDHDRETIEAKRETRGKFDAMRLLLDCLKRRENWPEQFIAALEECEHTTMAAEVRAEYDRLRVINSPSPPAPPLAARAQPAVDLPSEAVTPEPLPIQEMAPPSTPAVPALEVPTPPQIATQIEAMVVPPVTPPPSPETPRASASPTPPPEPMEFISHQEPEENTEPDTEVQYVPVEVVTVEEVEEVPVAPQEEPCETEATELVQAATMVDQPTPPPAIVDEPTATITDLDDTVATSTITEEPKFTTTIAEEPILPTSFENEPIPVAIIVDQPTPTPAIVEKPIASITDLDEPIATSTMTEEPKLPTSFVNEPTPALEEFAQTITFVEKAAPVTTPDDDLILTTSAVKDPFWSSSPLLTDLDDPILTPDKPPVQDTNPPTDTALAVVKELEETTVQPDKKVIVKQIEVASSPPPEVDNDYAVSNDEGPLSEDDICFSKPGVLVSVEPPNQDNTTLCAPAHESNPYSGDSGRLAISEEPAEENCITNNKSEEKMFESPAPSLDMEDVRENVGHVEEEPSNLNLDVQTPVIHGNEETAKVINSILPTLDTSLISCNVEQDAEEPSMVNQESLNQQVDTPLIQVNKEKGKEMTPVPSTPATMISAPSCNMEHVAEEPIIVSQEVEATLIQGNGETAKEIISELPTLDTSLISCNVEQDAEEPSMVNQEPLNQQVETPLIQVNKEKGKEMTPVPSTPATMVSAPSCNMEQDADEPSILNQEVQSSLIQEVETPLIQVNSEKATATPATILISDASSIVVHVEEEPSILNQEVQVPLIQVNGEKAKENSPVIPTIATDNNQLSMPALGPKQPDSEETSTSRLNTRYILTAAGVGACALLIAWRFKH